MKLFSRSRKEINPKKTQREREKERKINRKTNTHPLKVI